MALHIGELVAGLRLDDRPYNRTLTSAELRLRGFTRDADGRLRDARGRFTTESEAMGRSLSRRIGEGARGAVTALMKISPAVVGIGAGLPVVAAVGTALGGLVAGAVAAGIAAKAFQLAAQPQLEAVAEAAGAAEAADAAHEKVLLKKRLAADLAAKGGDAYKKALADVASATRAATEADAAAEAQMKGLPPATRATAVALAGLKNDQQAWSDSLAGSTMPVFTRGIEILRALLPTLTPFVKAGAAALGDFLDRVAVGVRSANFKGWAADMAAASGTALKNFLTAIGNIAKGFGGLLQAFLPASAGVTGGLVAMTAAFATWGAGLKGSEGFAQFIELAGQGGQMLGSLAAAAVKLLIAVSPLIGVTTQLALGLANVINNTPAPVLTALAAAITTTVIAMKAYAAYTAVTGAATDFLETRLGRVIKTWLRSAATAVASGTRMAASAVVSATQAAGAWAASAARMAATWVAGVVRAAAVSVGQFALMAARGVAWAATMAAQWLVAMGPVGWVIAAVVGLTAVVVLNWDRIKRVTGAAWAWVWGKIKSVGAALLGYITNLPLVSFFLRHWDRIRTGTASRVVGLITYVRSLPGRIKDAIGNLGSLLTGVGRSIIQGLINGVTAMIGALKDKFSSITGMIPDWKGPMAVDLRLLGPSGQALMTGLMTGIDQQVPALQRQLRGITSGIVASVGAPTLGGAAMAGLVSPAPPLRPASGSGRGAASAVDRRTYTENRNTYNSYTLTQRDMTIRDLEALQRRQDARARVGRPR
ncbi:phage tail protein [Streptomyces odonnellii]|uniref:phage tail protein n=1 Tax=Streptomyces odonnellii TaxID=1417980 RepID=UPI0006268C25|nr:hypothetical protein [Streptomyces odonnellii]